MELDKSMYRIVGKACNGAAVGRTGWSPELLRLLLKSEATRDSTLKLLQYIINNEIDVSVRDRIVACNLSALPKSDDKVRPIAVGETIYKVLGQYLLSLEAEAIKAHFQPIQLGVATPNGCERIVSKISKDLTMQSILLTIDGQNAFNSPLRSAIRARLMEDPATWSRIVTMFNLAYATPSKLHFCSDEGEDVIIESARGTRQGDPLGAFLFCLVLQPILQAAQERFPNLDISAYMDDVTLHSTTGSTEDVLGCFDFIERELNSIGMSVHYGKCEWFSHIKVPAGREFEFRNRSEKGAIRILGAYLGDEDTVREILVKRIGGKIDRMFERCKVLGGHEAIVIFASCLVPQIAFALRTHPTSVTAGIAKHFDELTDDALSHFAEIDVDDVTSGLKSLPTRMGGLGWFCAADLAPLAYQASQSACAVDLALTGEELREARLSVASQKALAEELHKKVDANLRKIPEVARLLDETKMPGTSAFLRHVPRTEKPMAPPVASAALRLRVNKPHRMLGDSKTRCPGCQAVLAEGTTVAHLAGCTKIHGHNASSAHAMLKEAVKEILRHCGAKVEQNEPRQFALLQCPKCKEHIREHQCDEHHKECTHSVTLRELANQRRSGPDIRAKFHDGTSIVIDITLTSHTLGDKEDLEGTFSVRERAKEKLYKQMVEDNGEQFVTLCCTCTGALNGGAGIVAAFAADERHGDIMSDKEVRIAFSLAAITARATSLINAEKRLNVHHTQQFAPRKCTADLTTNVERDPAEHAYFPAANDASLQQQQSQQRKSTTHATLVPAETRPPVAVPNRPSIAAARHRVAQTFRGLFHLQQENATTQGIAVARFDKVCAGLDAAAYFTRSLFCQACTTNAPLCNALASTAWIAIPASAQRLVGKCNRRNLQLIRPITGTAHTLATSTALGCAYHLMATLPNWHTIVVEITAAAALLATLAYRNPSVLFGRRISASVKIPDRVPSVVPATASSVRACLAAVAKSLLAVKPSDDRTAGDIVTAYVKVVMLALRVHDAFHLGSAFPALFDIYLARRPAFINALSGVSTAANAPQSLEDSNNPILLLALFGCRLTIAFVTLAYNALHYVAHSHEVVLQALLLLVSTLSITYWKFPSLGKDLYSLCRDVTVFVGRDIVGKALLICLAGCFALGYAAVSALLGNPTVVSKLTWLLATSPMQKMTHVLYEHGYDAALFVGRLLTGPAAGLIGA